MWLARFRCRDFCMHEANGKTARVCFELRSLSCDVITILSVAGHAWPQLAGDQESGRRTKLGGAPELGPRLWAQLRKQHTSYCISLTCAPVVNLRQRPWAMQAIAGGAAGCKCTVCRDNVQTRPCLPGERAHMAALLRDLPSGAPHYLGAACAGYKCVSHADVHWCLTSNEATPRGPRRASAQASGRVAWTAQPQV